MQINPTSASVSPVTAIKVLIVDDSIVFRKVLTDVLAQDRALHVVGSAPNGSICMQKVQQLNPDVIILDLEMPVLDGMGVLRALKLSHPHIKTIIYSVHSERGAKETFDAMQLGAVDFLPKDGCKGGVEAQQQYLREQLIPKIKQFAKPATPPTPPSRIASYAARMTASSKREIIAVGVSTGGPNALAAFMPMLPKDLPVPVVIVQHMPPLFTRLLAERLDNTCGIHVVEAAAGMELEAGTAYIAPGDYHLTVKRQGAKIITALNQDPQENSCRPAVDVLFRSVGEVYGGAVVAVILTGMGKDGFLGVQGLKSRGAHVIAQDKATSVVWGMPGFVAEAGLANAIVPLENVAGEVTRCLSPSILRQK
jgi:two-component system chemotaxis response regulator CheB